ncbi:MAG: DUF4340 domain-containing protein [Phycisphaerae bacterium]
MRYSTTLILALAVLLVAVAVYVFRDRLTSEPTEPAKPAEALNLIQEVALADVAGATLLENADGELKTKVAFARTDGEWRLTEPVKEAADGYEVDRLLRACLEGQYRQTLEAGAAGQPDLKDLGLDPPAFRLTFTTKKKDSQAERTSTVDIGRRSAFGEGVYVRLDEAEKVYVLDVATLAERAGEKTDTYRSHDVATPARDQIVRIGLAGSRGEVVLDRSGAIPARRGWILAQPITARADPDAVDPLLQELGRLRVKEFAKEPVEDLARYGLTAPRLRVTLWKEAPAPEKPAETQEGAEEAKETKPKSEPTVATTLVFGSWADLKHKTVWLMTADAMGRVVSVDADVLKPLEKSADDLRDKRVLALGRNRVTRVEVKNAAGEFELKKAESGWRLLVPGRDETDADPDAVDKLLAGAADLKVIYYLSDEERKKDFAEGLKPQGHVRLWIEGEAAPQAILVGGSAESRTLVANASEPWIGRANENDLAWFHEGWLTCRDKRVLEFKAKDVTGLEVRTPDRAVVLERKGDAWKMVQPVEADPEPAFAEGLLDALKDLRCMKFVAATTDFKAHGLDPGQIVCTVTVAPQGEGAEPQKKTLRLAVKKDGSSVGRVDGSDLVFQAADNLPRLLAAEPLPRAMTEFSGADVTGLEIAAGGATLRLAREEGKWNRLDEAGKPAGEVQADAVRDLASAVGRLSAARWAAYDSKDLARFGLDNPAFKIKTATEEKEVTLLVSETKVPDAVAELVEEKPVRYAMLEGADRVAILAGSALQTILDAPKSLEKPPAK